MRERWIGPVDRPGGLGLSGSSSAESRRQVLSDCASVSSRRARFNTVPQ